MNPLMLLGGLSSIFGMGGNQNNTAQQSGLGGQQQQNQNPLGNILQGAIGGGMAGGPAGAIGGGLLGLLPSIFGAK
jgi:hypothetical protein